MADAGACLPSTGPRGILGTVPLVNAPEIVEDVGANPDAPSRLSGKSRRSDPSSFHSRVWITLSLGIEVLMSGCVQTLRLSWLEMSAAGK